MLLDFGFVMPPWRAYFPTPVWGENIRVAEIYLSTIAVYGFVGTLFTVYNLFEYPLFSSQFWTLFIIFSSALHSYYNGGFLMGGLIGLASFPNWHYLVSSSNSVWQAEVILFGFALGLFAAQLGHMCRLGSKWLGRQNRRPLPTRLVVGTVAVLILVQGAYAVLVALS
jgi:hypothetical protein